MANKSTRQALAQYIRQETADGEELVNLMLDVMRNRKDGRKQEKRPIDLKVRLAAAEWLSDRGWGKSPIMVDVEVTSDPAVALAEYSLEKLLELRDQIALAAPVVEAQFDILEEVLDDAH